MTHEFIMLATVHFLALLSPGPDFIITVRQGLMQKVSNGVATSFGIAAGLLMHVAYCLMGLSFIISKSIIAFNMVKFLGAFYLIYLGFKGLKSKGTDVENMIKNNGEKRQSLFSAFRLGFLTNLLNPKVTLFMISIFSVVIQETTPLSIKLFYSLWMFVITGLWFSFVTVCFSNKRIKGFFVRFNRYVDKCFGGFLVLFGIKLALTKK